MLWQYFQAISNIPRATFNEEKIRQYILAEGKRLGCAAAIDDAGNVLLRKPATANCQAHPGVILQSHLDMVAQKNPAHHHNFNKDAIELQRRGEWLYANQTTLGADNGIGVAAMLAILANDNLQHPHLECLFTASEESGMHGAKGLQKQWLQGKTLLNLDSENEGEICVGGAGGCDVNIALTGDWQPLVTHKNAYCLRIEGLKGGHSGIDIAKQRGNANMLLARIFSVMNTVAKCELATWHGGNMRNAIARDAQLTFVSCAEQARFNIALFKEISAIRNSLAADERQFVVHFDSIRAPQQVMSAEQTQQILALICNLPDGVWRFDVENNNNVETSMNVAIVKTNEKGIDISCLLRSNSDAQRDYLANCVCSLARLGNAQATIENSYPSWQAKYDLEINKILQETSQAIFGRRAELRTIHAGLECAILAQHYPHWQIASFGPTIIMPHSPEECVNIPSVARFYRWLCATLAALGGQKDADLTAAKLQFDI